MRKECWYGVHSAWVQITESTSCGHCAHAGSKMPALLAKLTFLASL
jgi:hypothetical protein